MKSSEEVKKYIGNAIRSLYQMIMAVDSETMECHVVDYNQELRNISGDIEAFDIFCERLIENIHPEERELFRKFTDPDYFPKELENKVFTSMECRIRQVNRSYYWSDIIFCNATEEDSSEGHKYLFLIQDIHEWKEKEIHEEKEQKDVIRELQDKYNNLFEENMIDQQTGCYNRKGLKYYLDLTVEEVRASNKYLFLCVADLNGLKYLNDTYGHLAGDEAISAISKILLNSAPTGTRIVRTGGDEFLMFSTIEVDSKEPGLMEKKIEESVKKYNIEHDNPYDVGVSYGYVIRSIDNKDDSVDCIIEEADSKMYEMKIKSDKHRRM